MATTAHVKRDDVPATEVTLLRLNPRAPQANTSLQARQAEMERTYALCRHERLILDLDQRWAHCPDCDSEWGECR